MGPDRPEHLAVSLRVAPAKVRIEQVTDQVVGQHTIRSDLDDRQPRPASGTRRAGRPSHQRHLGADLRTSFSPPRRPPAPAGAPLTAPRSRAAPTTRPRGRPAPWSGDVRIAGQHIDHQRQGQRMAVRKREHLGLSGHRNAAPTQVAASIVRLEVAKRHDPKHLRPGSVGAPLRSRRQPARDHRDRRRRKPGQQTLTEPPIQGTQPLIAIDQQNHPLAERRQDWTTVSGHLQTPQHPGRPGGCPPHPGPGRGPRGRLQHQRPPRTHQAACSCPRPRGRDEQHPQPRIIRVERGPEEVQLSHATDELLSPTSFRAIRPGFPPGKGSPRSCPQS